MVSDQIISVVNNLCDKFGIAIDWSQKNMQPYLEELMHKAVNYKFCTSVMWLAVGILLVFFSVFAAIKFCNTHDDYDDEILRMLVLCMAFAFVIFSILMILGSIETLITCKTFPEKIVFDMLSHYLK